MGVEIADSIFREYDIRGRFGVDLTAEFAEILAAGFALYLKRRTGRDNLKVTVGRDVRLSSDPLRDCLVKGLVESGLNVVDLGVCPTPLHYFSLHTRPSVDGGIMITGSHNPPEYNGFKVSVGTETIYGEEIQKLKALVKEALQNPPKTSLRGSLESFDIISSYIDYHARGFSKSISNLKKPVKLAIDAGNGTGGLVAPALLKRLGCEVVPLFCEPDGAFPNHHPDPTIAKNLESLMEKVKSEGAHFGVAYDGDADRIGVVDEQGAIIWGDMLMVIFARAILKTNPNSTIVGEVKSSHVMYDEIETLGGKAVMWKAGHSLIKAKMKELGAKMAGEMSGHIFFADRYFGFDDAIYATLRLVEIVAGLMEGGEYRGFSGLLKGLPKTFATPEIRIDCPDDEKFNVVEKLRSAIKKGTDIKIKNIVEIDGLRIMVEKGWVLVRASNTQPALVLRCEAESEALLGKLREFIGRNLKAACPKCVVPS